MHTLALTLALTAVPLASPATPQSSAVLATAPAEALFLAYSPDVSAVREAMTDNSWYGYFIEGPGAVYVDWVSELFMDLEDGGQQPFDVLDSFEELARAADGELLVYATDRALAITLSAGEQRGKVDQELTEFLEGLPVQWTVTQSEMHGHTLQLWTPEEGEVVIGRTSGAGTVRVFIGARQEKVLPVLRASLSAEAGEGLTPEAERIASRVRGDVPRFVLVSDLRKLGELVLEKSKGSEEQAGIEQFLTTAGLDQPTWLLADVHRGRDGALHQVLKLQFQPETGLARLTDHLHQVELADLTGVPLDADYLGVGRVDVAGMIETFLDLAGPELQGLWDNSMAAGESATGVHLQEDVLGLFTGRFAYWRERWPEGGVPLADVLQGVTLRIGVLDGEALQDSLFDLLDSTGMGNLYDVDEVGEYDAWLPADRGMPGLGLEEGALPSLVFTPEALLVCSSTVDLEATVAHFEAERVPIVSDSGAAGEVLAALEGSYFVTRQEMVDTVQSITSQLHLLGEMLQAELGEEPTRAELHKWFPGRTTVTYRRTDEGLEIVGTVR